jgi:putative membrane protein
MNKLLILLTASASLGACATNDLASPPAAPMAAAAVDPNNPLFYPMYMSMAASGDQFEIQSSQLALQASQNQAVRNFANLMISQHQGTTANLMSAAQSAGLPPPAPTLLPMQAQMLQQLQAAGTGPAFDAAYKQAQIMAHQEALNLHSNYASNGDVPALRQVASAAVPIIQMHLQQAQQLNVDAMPMPMQQPSTSGGGRAGERG